MSLKLICFSIRFWRPSGFLIQPFNLVCPLLCGLYSIWGPLFYLLMVRRKEEESGRSRDVLKEGGIRRLCRPFLARALVLFFGDSSTCEWHLF